MPTSNQQLLEATSGEIDAPDEPKPKPRRPAKKKPKEQVFEHYGIKIATTSGCRPSKAKALAREIRRHLSRGTWQITADIGHTSPEHRGKGPAT